MDFYNYAYYLISKLPTHSVKIKSTLKNAYRPYVNIRKYNTFLLHI